MLDELLRNDKQVAKKIKERRTTTIDKERTNVKFDDYSETEVEATEALEFIGFKEEKEEAPIVLSRYEDEIPWLSYKTQQLSGIRKLHHEILDFYEYLKPNESENALKVKTLHELEDCLLTALGQDFKLKLFGSFPVGLNLPDSDIDVVLISKDYDEHKHFEAQMTILRRVSDILYASKLVSYVRLIEAKVPIVQATWKSTGVRIDVSSNRNNGHVAKNQIKKILNAYPFMRPLIYVLKYFLKQKKLNETYTGGISSFILFNLVFSFVQQTLKNKEKQKDIMNLGSLLLEFFTLYGYEFNYYDIGISVRKGGFYFNKKERDWLQSNKD